MRLYRVNVEKMPKRRDRRQEEYEMDKRIRENEKRGREKAAPLRVDQTYFVKAHDITDVYSRFFGKGQRGKLLDVREATEEEYRLFGSIRVRKKVDYVIDVMYDQPTKTLPTLKPYKQRDERALVLRAVCKKSYN
ncbi:MAG: hypothetical protein HY831_03430 [Candidatus Aenigmarchaeota archaeon]|nr:hypothetical protein [Candidatus Aenigmarchaeota archaeon]